MKETDTKVGGVIHGEGLDLKYHAPTDEFISICTKMDSGCNEPNKVKNGANANPHANTKMDSGKIRWHLIPTFMVRTTGKTTKVTMPYKTGISRPLCATSWIIAWAYGLMMVRKEAASPI